MWRRGRRSWQRYSRDHAIVLWLVRLGSSEASCGMHVERDCLGLYVCDRDFVSVAEGERPTPKLGHVGRYQAKGTFTSIQAATVFRSVNGKSISNAE